MTVKHYRNCVLILNSGIFPFWLWLTCLLITNHGAHYFLLEREGLINLFFPQLCVFLCLFWITRPPFYIFILTYILLPVHELLLLSNPAGLSLIGLGRNKTRETEVKVCVYYSKWSKTLRLSLNWRCRLLFFNLLLQLSECWLCKVINSPLLVGFWL